MLDFIYYDISLKFSLKPSLFKIVLFSLFAVSKKFWMIFYYCYHQVKIALMINPYCQIMKFRSLHPILSLTKKTMETETKTWSKFPNRGQTIVEEILASEDSNKSKRAGLWESQSGNRVGKIWLRSFEIQKLLKSSPGLPVPPESVSQSLWWTLKSPETTH